MNKEQQIEEMKKVMCEEYGKECNFCPCSDCANAMIAENLYNAGYRKVPDGAVILTPEERDEELKACNEKQAELEAEIERLKADNEKLKKMNDIAHVLLGQAIRHIDVDEQLDRYMQASKEGAQEFAKKLKSKLNDYHDGGEKGAYLTENDIDEILKEFTE